MKELIFSFSKNDFRVDTFRSGGKGGQNQNKRDTGVRITHIESGLSAESREHRTQLLNKREAFFKLCDELVSFYCSAEDKERYPSTEIIRTYSFCDDRIVDHDSGRKYSTKKTFNKGNYPFIKDRLYDQSKWSTDDEF